MSFAEIEQTIKDFIQKSKMELFHWTIFSGGTFTITNGGVFGSLMSTPILNPPQVAILGLHKIEERPIAVNGQVLIRPMMYVALSYDHRVVDGRESVQFLARIKQLLKIRLLSCWKPSKKTTKTLRHEFSRKGFSCSVGFQPSGDG